MSVYWTPYCTICEERGPSLRNPHSGANVRLADGTHVRDLTPFGEWLEQHEYHGVRLLFEGEDPNRKI